MAPGDLPQQIGLDLIIQRFRNQHKGMEAITDSIYPTLTKKHWDKNHR